MTIGSKDDILRRIGKSLKEHRLRQNVPQGVLAERSGVSLTSVRRLEGGLGATLGTFVQVCRTLGLDGWISDIEPKDSLSPIAYAEALKEGERHKRRRAHV